MLERRTVTTIVEFEEKYSHGFDNTNGTDHISGYYQWIDKVHAGPGLQLRQAPAVRRHRARAGDQLHPRPDAERRPWADARQAGGVHPPRLGDQRGNYLQWAKQYDATGLEPPPPPVKTVVKAFAGVFRRPDHESTESATLAIDDGYRAKYCSFVKDAVRDANAQWRVFVG